MKPGLTPSISSRSSTMKYSAKTIRAGSIRKPPGRPSVVVDTHLPDHRDSEAFDMGTEKPGAHTSMGNQWNN